MVATQEEPAAEKKDLLNAQQVADRLRCSKATIYRLCKDRQISYSRIAYDYRFTEAQVEEFIKRNTVTAQPKPKK